MADKDYRNVTSEQLLKELEHCWEKAAEVERELAARGRTGSVPLLGNEHCISLISNLHAGVCVHAPDTSIVFCNSRASALLGLNTDETLGKMASDPVWNFAREDGSKMPISEYPVNLVITTRQPVKNLVVGIHKPLSGEIEWVLVNAFPEYDNNGELLNVVVTFVDITERKQAEEALAASEEMFRAIAENIPGVVFTYDHIANSRREMIYVGPGVRQLLGEQLTAELADDVDRFVELVHPDDRRLIDEADEESYRPDRPIDLEYRIRTLSGDYKWVRCISHPIRLDNDVIRWHGVVLDITDRKLAEEALQQAKQGLEKRVRERTAELAASNKALRQEMESHLKTEQTLKESESALRALMNATTESIFLISTDYTIVAINEAGAGRLGSTPDKMIGKSLADFFPPDVFESRKRQAEKAIATGEPIFFEDERDGIVFDANLYPVFGSDGNVELFAVFSQDITERKRAEEKLLQLNTRLEEERQLLEDKTIALREIMSSIDREKKQLQSQLHANVECVVLPHLSKLAEQVPRHLKPTVELLRDALTDVTEPFVRKLGEEFTRLSPRELEVCRMVRAGLQSKEIAAILNVSPRTVQSFRLNIRKKLGLTDPKSNLSTYLQSF